MAPLGENNCHASCGAACVPVDPVRDFKIEGWLVGTEAGGQGGKAAGPLTTETVANRPTQLL